MVNTTHPSLPMPDPNAIRVPLTQVAETNTLTAEALRAIQERLSQHGLQIQDADASQLEQLLAGRLRGLKLALSRRELGLALAGRSYWVHRAG
jgi:hypothetical protein